MKEHEKAREWREALNLTVKQLAEMTGYSREAIILFEKGITSQRTWSTNTKKSKPGPISETVWRRYRNCCAGVQAQLSNGRFEW